MLVKTSRSFAMVIQELGQDLRDAVCIFYLVLRALDTIGMLPDSSSFGLPASTEDDTSYLLEKRVPALRTFYQKLDVAGWTFAECMRTA
jgi:farnesyl-diphosphate farnesyltransferase